MGQKVGLYRTLEHSSPIWENNNEMKREETVDNTVMSKVVRRVIGVAVKYGPRRLAMVSAASPIRLEHVLAIDLLTSPRAPNFLSSS